jgi:hypothetical protein
MYYRRLKFCIIYLALNRGCFEAVLMKITSRPLGVNNGKEDKYEVLDVL